MKPRIKRLRGRWVCYDGRCTGYGTTVSVAYVSWQYQKEVLDWPEIRA